MGKVALSLLAMLLVISLAVTSAFANGNGKDKGNKKEEEQKQEILAELDIITERKQYISVSYSPIKNKMQKAQLL